MLTQAVTGYPKIHRFSVKVDHQPRTLAGRPIRIGDFKLAGSNCAGSSAAEFLSISDRNLKSMNFVCGSPFFQSFETKTAIETSCSEWSAVKTSEIRWKTRRSDCRVQRTVAASGSLSVGDNAALLSVAPSQYWHRLS